MSKLEIVKNWKLLNWQVAKTDICQNWTLLNIAKLLNFKLINCQFVSLRSLSEVPLFFFSTLLSFFKACSPKIFHDFSSLLALFLSNRLDTKWKIYNGEVIVTVRIPVGKAAVLLGSGRLLGKLELWWQKTAWWSCCGKIWFVKKQ